jgi:hypothetical protein
MKHRAGRCQKGINSVPASVAFDAIIEGAL